MSEPGKPGASRSDRDAAMNSNVTWTDETRRYRRGVGGWWWGALILVPAILALVGMALGNGSESMEDAASPSPSSSQVAAAGPFGIAKDGDTITLTGEVPDDAAKSAVVQAAKDKAGSATVVDNLTVNAAATGPAAAGVGGVVAAMADMTSAKLDSDGTATTLTGEAPTEAAKTAAGDAAKALFPDQTITNNITVAGGGDSAKADDCAKVTSDIAALLEKEKFLFATGTATLAQSSVTTVGKIAPMIKGCPDAKVAVDGYTDNVGDAAANKKLSQQRADAVKAELVKAGVPAASITATGHGDADPIAPNNSDANRALNRRVEITVS